MSPAPEPSNARTFGRNFGSTAASQLVAQVLTLATSIVLARQLSVPEYGVFVFGFAFPSWFLLLVSLGLDEVIAIEVAADRSRAGRFLALAAGIRLALGALAIVALWAALQFVLDDPFARTISLVLGSSSVVMTLAGTFTALFRGFEKLEYAALVTILERALTVGAVLVLLFSGFGLYEVSLAFLAGSFVALGLSAAIARTRFAWFRGGVGGPDVVATLRSAAPFALLNAVGTFAYTGGVVLLTILRDEAATGLFNAAFTLLLALFSFLSIVSLAALPMMSRVNRESREKLQGMLHRIQRLSFVAGVPLAFGGWIYAREIMTLFYGDAFAASTDSFRILVLSFAVETAAMGIGPALAATGHAREKLYIGSVGAAITIALSVVLIPGMGPVGVALGFLLSRIVTAILGGLAIRRYVAPLRAMGAMGKSVAAGLLMVVVLLAFPGLPLGAGLLVGGGVYFAALWAIHGMPREDRVVVWNAIRGALFR